MSSLDAVRLIAGEVGRLDTGGVAGLEVRGLGTSISREYACRGRSGGSAETVDPGFDAGRLA